MSRGILLNKTGYWETVLIEVLYTSMSALSILNISYENKEIFIEEKYHFEIVKHWDV